MPGGLIGPLSNSVNRYAAVLAGVRGVPEISPGSSSSSFDKKHENFPTFARTVPSTPSIGEATVELLRYWNVSHAGCLYELNEYGLSFFETVVERASEHGITVGVAGYDGSDEQEIRAALESLKDYRYIVAALARGNSRGIMKIAHEVGLVSDNHVWVIAQLSGPTRSGYTMERTEENEIVAEAFNGAVSVDVTITPPDEFHDAIDHFQTDPALNTLFAQSHVDDVFQGVNFDELVPSYTSNTYTNYDAVMAMGIAACQLKNETFFTGVQHFEQITRIAFDGASGRVSFDEIGTRPFESVMFSFTNILVDEEGSDNETIRFKSRVSLLLDGSDTFNSASPRNTLIKMVEPFVFQNGGTERPLSLPLLDEQMNQISPELRGLGWGLGILAMLMAVYFGVWTWRTRNNELVRISQPFFLGMMCIGTFLMASSILFLGWEEPWSHLDFACMAGPWLLTLGFSTAFSALFAKTWRINRLFRSSVEMQRTNVLAKDVLWPFLLMTVTNLVLLTIWQVVSPLEFVRSKVGGSTDRYGRRTHSNGHCRGDSPVWWVILVVFNFLMVLFANYQSYVARNIPTDFNETFYVALSMASLLECFLIGAPIIFVASGDPSAAFVLKAVVVAFGCGCILVPIYTHKFRGLPLKKLDVDEMNQAWSLYSGSGSGGKKGQRSSLRMQQGGSGDGDLGSAVHDTVAKIRASAARKSVSHMSGSQSFGLDVTDESLSSQRNATRPRGQSLSHSRLDARSQSRMAPSSLSVLSKDTSNRIPESENENENECSAEQKA